MAISEPYTGSVSIGTTEISLTNANSTIATQTTDGVFQLFIDFNAMTATEEYEIKFKEKARSADTQRDFYVGAVDGVQNQLWVSPSMILLHGWDMTLKKLAGTDRTITWSIRQVA